MSYKTFISHSNEDVDTATYIFNILKRIEQFPPYMAKYYQDYGEDFKKDIQNELYNSHFMIVLLTEGGIKSQWVNQEIGYAYALKAGLLGLRKIPFIIPISYKNIATFLKGFITKDHIDILFIDEHKFPEDVIFSLLTKMRNYIPRGLEEGVLTVRTECSNCVDKMELPYKYRIKIPSHDDIIHLLETHSQSPILECNCNKCHYINYIDARTFLPVESG